MTDIVTRLRDWRNVHLARLHLLMDEAADEMARLRADNSRRANLEQGLRDGIVRLRLTDVERAAVQRAVQDETEHGLVYTADRLQSMLDRLSGSGDFPAPVNAANEDNTLATHAAPRGGREQDGCTLTDAAEVRRLRGAITALADQDATLSVCDGSVTVTMDATLTAKERKAVAFAAEHFGAFKNQSATLRGLLEKHEGGAR